MDYFPYIGFGVMTFLYLLERFWARRDMEKMLNRIMARGFEEYQYYDKKYQTDLSELKKIRNEERKIRDYEEKDVFEDDSIARDDQRKVKEALKQYGSDWSADEVDAAQILEMEKERLADRDKGDIIKDDH